MRIACDGGEPFLKVRVADQLTQIGADFVDDRQ
jgi:hypothetical protein